MDLNITEEIIEGLKGDVLHSNLLGGIVEVQVRRAIMGLGLLDGERVSVSISLPTVIFSATATVPGFEVDNKKISNAWVNTDVINIADIPFRPDLATGRFVHESPYHILRQVTRIAQKLANGATVRVANDQEKREARVQALIKYGGKAFVASFQIADDDERYARTWAIEALKNPIKFDVVDACIKQGYKGTLPPKDWDFLKGDLVSIVYEGERVWGLKAELANGFLAIVNYVENAYGHEWRERTTRNKEFGEG